MRITQAQLLRAVSTVNKDALDAFVAAINMWAVHYGIDTPRRMTHFLAQVFAESGELRYTEENLNYSADGLLKTFQKYFNATTARQYARQPERIANKVYARRMGNGYESSGDGWRYRGRGYIQCTGKSNYALYAKSDLCSIDAVAKPELLAMYPDNVKSALWYWESRNLNAIADRDDGGNIGETLVEEITRKVNGGLNGLAARQAYYKRFRKEIGI